MCQNTYICISVLFNPKYFIWINPVTSEIITKKHLCSLPTIYIVVAMDTQHPRKHLQCTFYSYSLPLFSLVPSAKVVKDIPKGVLATDKSITTQAPFCVDLMEKTHRARCQRSHKGWACCTSPGSREPLCCRS